MKIGFNCSSFDLFHAGHVTMLRMEKELCDYLKVALQVDPTKDRPGHDRRYSTDITKIRHEIKWSPRFSLDEGLNATIEWYERNWN